MKWTQVQPRLGAVAAGSPCRLRREHPICSHHRVIVGARRIANLDEQVIAERVETIDVYCKRNLLGVGSVRSQFVEEGASTEPLSVAYILCAIGPCRLQPPVAHASGGVHCSQTLLLNRNEHL